jgi:putative endonuclease
MKMTGVLGRLIRRDPPGRAGESLACRHLQAKGFAIVDRNYRCRSGEIDIVARDGGVTVFVEVKERHGQSHGEGFEAVTFGKRRRLIRAARLYAAVHGLSETPIRFDVVSIDWAPGERVTPVIRHDEGAFDSDGL